MFIIPKKLSKEEIKRKRKKFFENIYQRNKKLFFENKTKENFSLLQKSASRLVKAKVFHKNKCSRLISKFNKMVEKK